MSNNTTTQPSYKRTQIDLLQFDPGNPRFFGSGADRGKTQDQLYSELMKKYGALGLVDSILVNGFMPYEPLIVRPEDGKFIVIEGNRRLAAVRFILKNRSTYDSQSKYPLDDLKELPCIIFEEKSINAKAREQTYLGLRHFSGYKNWSPISKAEYLIRQLKGGMVASELAVRLNTTKSRLKKYIVAVNLLNKVDKSFAKTSSENFMKFWVLAESLQRSSIQGYIGLETNPDSFKVESYNKTKFGKLRSFLYGSSSTISNEPENEIEPVISDTRQISLLAEVLSSSDATKTLEKTRDLNQALAHLPKSSGAIKQLHNSSIESVKAFARAKPSDPQKRKLLTEIKHTLEVH